MVSIKSCHGLKGDKLKVCQKKARLELRKKHGGDYDHPWLGVGITTIDTRVGKIVPIPPQTDWFIHFKKNDAEKLANELEKLKDEPVVLTGGGAYSYIFAFLDDVNVTECGHPVLRNPMNNMPIEDEEGNIFYHNNFINSLVGHATVVDTANNIYYNSAINEGNYWDDYNGVDEDPKDGIGDIPYIIENDNNDMCPLMSPSGE